MLIFKYFTAAAHQPSRPVLIQKGVIPPVVHLCTKSVSQQVLSNSAEVLRNLARADGFRKLMVDGEVVASLVQLCDRGDVIVKQFATGALANLALNNAATFPLVKEVVTDIIFGICKDYCEADATVLSNAVVILRNLAKHEYSRNKLLGQGLVSILSCLKDCKDDRVVENSSLTMLNLAFDDRGANMVVDEGGMPLLVSLAISTRDATKLGFILKAFSKLSDRQPYRSQLVEDGIIDALAAVCETTTVMQVVSEAVAVLCKFTEPSCRVLEANDNKDWKHVTLGALQNAERTLKKSVPAALKKRLDLAIVKLQPKGDGKFV